MGTLTKYPVQAFKNELDWKILYFFPCRVMSGKLVTDSCSPMYNELLNGYKIMLEAAFKENILSEWRG